VVVNYQPLAALDDRVLSGVAARTRTTDALETFNEQGARCGWCAHPIRLIGSVTSVDSASGEVVRTYSTNDEPDGLLLKACGTRRATRCPSCAATYASDARMLVRSGMSGGKGVPDTVSSHPMVFATVTAPSFGTVHGTRSRNRPCRPGAKGHHCTHGRNLNCWTRHHDGDAALGEPLCGECYDYERAVLWNATCPELWRRTTIYVRRELARQLKLGIAQFNHEVRLSFVKVAEFQRRGVVHLHAVIRLDNRDDEGIAPAVGIDVAMLTAAIHTAVSKVSAPLPLGFSDEPLGLARWGQQLDVRVIATTELDGTDVERARGGTSSPSSSSRAIANYIAKYATKSSDDTGALDHRLASLDDLDDRRVTGHLRRLVETAWNLGSRPHLERLRAWAHSLGFGGHWLTKSRRYSVTFALLRRQRREWQIRRTNPLTTTKTTISLGLWKWVGTGWLTAGDEWLAAVGQRARARSRIEAREALLLERNQDAACLWDGDHESSDDANAGMRMRRS
jgi:hypothetical protein